MRIKSSIFRGIISSRDKVYIRNIERGQKTKDKILFLIAKSEPDGISTKDLAKYARLHRSHVHKICEEYIDKGIVKKSGKLGKYHLGPKASDDIHLRARILQRKIVERFFTPDKPTISISNKFCNLEHYKSSLICEQNNEFTKVVSKRTQDLEEFCLFEYCLKLGAIITYQILQSVRYAYYELIRFEAYNHKRKNKLHHAPESPDEIHKINEWIIKWIDNAITPQSLIQTFSLLSLVNKGMSTPKEGKSSLEKNSAEQLLLDFVPTEMEKTFKSIFPQLAQSPPPR